MTSHDRADLTGADLTGADLTELVNVGRAVAGYFERVGITRIAQLAGRNPIELYEQISAASGEALDPCPLDTIVQPGQREGLYARWGTSGPAR